MFTLVLVTVVAIVAIIGSIKMYNQIKNIQIDISEIKKDNERRIEYNKQRNEKRKVSFFRKSQYIKHNTFNLYTILKGFLL